MLLPLTLTPSPAALAASEALSHHGDTDERGAFFTKPEIVAGILDLCSYREDEDLAAKRLLDPAVGNGEFFLVAVERLLSSYQRHHGDLSASYAQLAPCIRGVELHQKTYHTTRTALIAALQRSGLSQLDAESLAQRWLIQGDFLLTPLDGKFDVIVGNPPYVRQERIPAALLEEYKLRFQTLYDRADLYIPFYERCLDLLDTGSVLGFICANRWIKNKYGGPLREKIAAGFNLDVYIDLAQLDAFSEQVDAYPAITIIRRAPPSTTRVLTSPRGAQTQLSTHFEQLHHTRSAASPHVSTLSDVSAGRDPWLLDAPEILKIVRHLEQGFPTLEEAGAKVGIGVATGADKIYIGPYDELPVEPERLLPLALAADLRGTRLLWSGHGLINPWMPDGSLARLEEHPRFAAHMLKHQDALKARHTAKKSPLAWFKTIDRVYPSLTTTPKLLIPDIKADATVVYDEGHYYPHHNLYVITAEGWDLRALQALLRSSVSLTFIAAYSIRMAGGFLRFQAQYLRRIRIPSWATLTATQRSSLIQLSTCEDQAALDEAVADAFSLTTSQSRQLQRFADVVRTTRANP